MFFPWCPQVAALPWWSQTPKDKPCSSGHLRLKLFPCPLSPSLLPTTAQSWPIWQLVQVPAEEISLFHLAFEAFPQATQTTLQPHLLPKRNTAYWPHNSQIPPAFPNLSPWSWAFVCLVYISWLYRTTYTKVGTPSIKHNLLFFFFWDIIEFCLKYLFGCIRS